MHAHLKEITTTDNRDPSQIVAEDLSNAEHDARMSELFVLFDADLNGQIEFKELVAGLMKIMPKVTVSKAKETAVQALLLCDSASTRMLDYPNFVNFIVNFCIAGGFHFKDIAELLVYRAASGDPEQSFVNKLQDFENSDVMETVLDKRIHVVFNLFDLF